MAKSLLLSLFLCIRLNAYSQNLIKGSVTDSLGGPIPFCAMALLKAADSSLVKGNVSDSAGTFMFEKIKPGSYLLNSVAQVSGPL